MEIRTRKKFLAVEEAPCLHSDLLLALNQGKHVSALGVLTEGDISLLQALTPSLP